MTAEASRGWGWTSVLHPDDAEQCTRRWQHSLATGEPYEVEFRLRRADGMHRWHLGRARAFVDETGMVTKWFGTSTDIDDRKKLEEESRRIAEFQQRRVGIVSHDIRSPLSAIVATTGTLLAQ